MRTAIVETKVYQFDELSAGADERPEYEVMDCCTGANIWAAIDARLLLLRCTALLDGPNPTPIQPGSLEHRGMVSVLKRLAGQV